MTRPVACALAALLVSALGCESRRDVPRDQPSSSAPSAAPSAPAAASSSAPAPSASSAPAPSASAPSSVDVEPWRVGTWRGSASTYGGTDGGRQHYDRRDVVVVVGADGHVTFRVGRGEGVGADARPAAGSCDAEARLGRAGKLLSLAVDRTTCPPGRAGAPLEIRETRVGDCLVQWEVQRGIAPFAREQIALRRDGCR